jgi:hypothetical protein
LAVAASIVELAVTRSSNALGGDIGSDRRGDKRRAGFEPALYGHPYGSLSGHCHVLVWLQHDKEEPSRRVGWGVYVGVVPAVRHVSYSHHVVQFDRGPSKCQYARSDN